MLNQYFIALLTTGIIHFSLALLVFLKNVNRKLNQSYALYSTSIAVWSIFEAFGITRYNESLALWLWRLNHIGVIFIPIFFVHFIFILLEIKGRKRRLIPLSYIAGLTFLILDATPLLILEVVPKFSFRYFINPGRVYFAFFFLWVVWALYGLVELLREFFRTSGYRRNQMKYFCWSMVIAYIGGVPNFFPTFNIEIPLLMPYGTYAILLYAFFTAYAITRYRLMNIDLAIRRVLSFLGYALATILIFTPIFMFTPHSLPATVLCISLLTFTAPFLFKHLPHYTRGFVDKFVFRGKFGYLDEINSIWDEPGVDIYITFLIADRSTRFPYEIMELDNALFFVHRRRKKRFRPIVDLGLEGVVLPEPIGIPYYEEDDFFIQYLQKAKKTILREEVSKDKELNKVMEELQAELVIPMFERDRLIGFVSYGKKLNGEMFHIEDIQALEKQVQIAARHLSHTLFMEERVAFSQDLAHDVKNLFDKGIFFTLESLLNAKDDKERRKITKTLIRQLRYMKACLGEVFDVVTILNKAITKDLEATPEELRKLVQEATLLYKDSYDNKGLYIHLEISQNLPKVMVNKADIKKVFGNLLDNSFKNTKEGGVTIKAEVKEKEEVLVTFSDTGKGIPEEELNNIFEPNLRLPEEGEEGTGMGMVIIREIIEAHRGRIWVESEVSKGTRFYFTLPLVAE